MADRNRDMGAGGAGDAGRNPELDDVRERDANREGAVEGGREASRPSRTDSLAELDPASTNSQREGQRQYGDDRSSGVDQPGGDPATNGEI